MKRNNRHIGQVTRSQKPRKVVTAKKLRAQRKRDGASANGAERERVFQDGLPQMISAEAMQLGF